MGSNKPSRSEREIMLLRRLLTYTVIQFGGEVKVPRSFFEKGHRLGMDIGDDEVVLAVDMDGEG